jgi:hypothetical protein
MFGRLAVARPNQAPLTHIEPQFDQSATICDVPAGDSDWLSAASPEQQELDRSQNTSAVDGAFLSLIPFAVAFVIVGLLFGASFVTTLAPRENIAARKLEEPKARVTSPEQTVLPRQSTATPLATPAPLPHAATPTSLPERTDPMDNPGSIPAAGQIYPPPAAPTIRPIQTAASEDVVQNISAPPATNSVPENTRQKQHEARIRFLREQVARSERQLTKPHLSAAETKRFEQQKAYWSRALQRTPAEP